MNLCKIGIHDYEKIDQFTHVRNIIDAHMVSKGFTAIYSDGILKCYSREGIRIYRSSYYDDDTINSCIPFYNHIKICLKCHKQKYSFNEEKIILELDKLINEHQIKYDRAQLAKRLHNQ